MERKWLVSMRYHRGIRIDRIPVSGIPGLLFTFATLFILLVGVPLTREFFLVTGIAGVIGSALLYFWHNQTRW
jgi:hypothetical protein